MNKPKRTWLFISMLLFMLLSLAAQPAQHPAQAAGCVAATSRQLYRPFLTVSLKIPLPDGSQREIGVQYGGELGIVIDCAKHNR